MPQWCCRHRSRSAAIFKKMTWYLQAHLGIIVEFMQQQMLPQWTVRVETDGGGCKRTGEPMNGGVLMPGDHLMCTGSNEGGLKR